MTITAPLATAHGDGRMVDTLGVPVVLWLANAAGTWAVMDDCRVLSVDIHTGRDNTSSPVCEPAALVLEIIDPTGTVSRSAVLHRSVAVMLSPAAVAYWGLPREYCLFAGTIAEVIVTADDDLGTVLTITAASHMADLGRTYVGDTPWAQEQATVRATRILQQVGYAVSLFAGYFDPTVLARDVDRQPALDLVAALATEALFDVVDYTGNVATWSGMPVATTWASVPATVTWLGVNTWLPQSSAGAMSVTPPAVPQMLLVASTWRDAFAAARAAGPAGAGVDLQMSACELAAHWAASYTYAGMVNRLSLSYGPTPSGGEQPQKIYTQQSSITKYGLLETQLSTDLATVADADTMATNLFATAAVSKPSLPALVFDLWATATKATGRAFLASGNRPLASFWYIPDLPELLPVNPRGYLWLEGVHHTITADGWTVEAAVSDPWPYGNAWQWVQMPPARTWASVPVAVTWATFNDWANQNPDGG
jgi:hypothetical protein